MTDLPSYTGAYDGTSLLEMVTPGNDASGVNYSITLTLLADFLAFAQTLNPTIITSGAVYNSVATDTRILINKTIGSATSVVLLASAGYFQPILVKDYKGDAATNPITVTFSGGQTMDGLASVVIGTNYGYFWFNPGPSGGFYDAS